LVGADTRPPFLLKAALGTAVAWVRRITLLTRLDEVVAANGTSAHIGRETLAAREASVRPWRITDLSRLDE
jgi:hypothetical protein